MSDRTKRKPSSNGGDRPSKKSKRGTAGQWQTPAQKAKMAKLGDRDAVIEVGDQGIWVTFARGVDRKAIAEFKRLSEGLGEELYDIKPAESEQIAADSGDEDGDIEASIKKELDGFSKPLDEEAAALAQKRPFSIITVQTECVFFVKTRAPVEPVEFCRKACEQAKACTNLLERKTKYINRLTPVTTMDKASENGVGRAIRHALAPWFDLKKLDLETEVEQEATTGDTALEAAKEEKPAYSYAIRPSIRFNNDLERTSLITRIADLIDPRHKVNLGKPDKVILVDVFKNFCGASVVDGSDWDGLRKLNINELYKISPGAASSATEAEKETQTEAQMEDKAT